MHTTAPGDINEKKKIPILFILLAAAAPVILALYSRHYLKSPVTFWWILDEITFVAFFLGIFFLVPPKRWLRIPILFLFTFWFVFFHVGNVIYYRFFDTWAAQDIFDQWKDALGLGKSVKALLTWRDLLIGAALPLTVAMVAAATKARVRAKITTPVLLLLAAALFGLHVYKFPPPLKTRHNDPLLYFIRAPLYAEIEKYQAVRKIKTVRGHMAEYYPYDETSYKRTPGKFGRLTLDPKNGKKGPETKYNVVLILMESVVAAASGTYGAEPSYTPTLDALAPQALVAKNFYANGSQTVRGEFSLLCSFYENLIGGPIYTKGNFYKTQVQCLPSVLKSFGYETMWISGYKKTYSKKSRFLSRHGVDKFFDQKSLPEGYTELGWGPSDEDTFASARERLNDASEPFFAEIMTLSNHHPFDFDYASNPFAPKGGYGVEYDNYMRGIYYTDYSIGKFFASVKNEEWFARTVFVICGDHGIWIFPEGKDKGPLEKQEAYFRVPFLIWAPGIVEPRVFEDVASQVDMAPTILDILGIRAKNAYVGRSLLKTFKAPRFSLMVHNRQWNLRRGDEYCYDVGEECFYEHVPYCEKGHKRSTEKTMSCFRFEGDLLRDPNAPSPPKMESNSPIERFADNLNAYNQYLLKNNQVFRP